MKTWIFIWTWSSTYAQQFGCEYNIKKNAATFW